MAKRKTKTRRRRRKTSPKRRRRRTSVKAAAKPLAKIGTGYAWAKFISPMAQNLVGNYLGIFGPYADEALLYGAGTAAKMIFKRGMVAEAGGYLQDLGLIMTGVELARTGFSTSAPSTSGKVF